MNAIEELTLKQIKELIAMFKGTNTPSTNEDDSHWEIGKNYFLRTVTHHVTGKLEKVDLRDPDENQMMLWNTMQNECEGMCGV